MRILVIEDEPEFARTLAKAIEESGMAAEVAHDGETGLDLALSFPWDAIVLDLLLPRRHGLSVLKELRAHDVKTPVLIISALDQDEEVIDGLDRGADDYLPKTFTLGQFLARLRALVRRGGGLRAPAALLTVGDLEIDLAAHVARRKGKTLDLTPREWALLVLFANRRGVALSRTEIGEHVVDREFETTSNLIDVSVHGLRAKLGQPALIHTVRGVGYRFEAPETA